LSNLQRLIPGPLPNGWTARPFWSLFRRRKQVGFPDEQLLSVYRDYGVIPKSSRDDNFNKEPEDLSGYQLVTEGSLVTNKMKAWQGSIAISRHRGIVSPAYYVYEPLSNEYDQFLHYLLRSQPYTALYGRISKGVRVNQWDLEHEALRNIPILLPPLATQMAIANFLDRETARVDQLVEKKQRLVELLGEKEGSHVAQMFSALNAEEWRVRHLGKVKNGAGFPVELQGDATQDIAFFKVRHLKTHGLDASIIDTDDTVSEETARSLRATVFPPRTIVFAKIGAALLLGRFSMIGRPACIDNNMAAFVPEERLIDPDYALLGLSQIDMRNLVQPGAVPSLSTEAFYSYAIPLPSKNAQASFVDEFRVRRAGIRQAISKTETSMQRLREFRAALITAAVTGQIDVRTRGEQGQSDRRLEQIEEVMRA
jgi:type I restriction enzyme S subunit